MRKKSLTSARSPRNTLAQTGYRYGVTSRWLYEKPSKPLQTCFEHNMLPLLHAVCLKVRDFLFGPMPPHVLMNFRGFPPDDEHMTFSASGWLILVNKHLPIVPTSFFHSISNLIYQKPTVTSLQRRCGIPHGRCCRQAASSVNYTTSCKHSLALPRMGEIIARNRLSWLKLLINRYCCI